MYLSQLVLFPQGCIAFKNYSVSRRLLFLLLLILPFIPWLSANQKGGLQGRTAKNEEKIILLVAGFCFALTLIPGSWMS